MATGKAFTPLTLGPLGLRNRFVKSGANEGMYRRGLPTKALVRHHREIAAGGAAMTTMAYCAVAPEGRTFADQLFIRPEALAPLRALTDAVHGEGAAISAQITHGGAFSFLKPTDGRRPGSASGGFNPTGALHGVPLKRALDPSELPVLADTFADGARLAREAGFDAVEIHMGHGYLLSQFLSPGENKRRDDFGAAWKTAPASPAWCCSGYSTRSARRWRSAARSASSRAIEAVVLRATPPASPACWRRTAPISWC